MIGAGVDPRTPYTVTYYKNGERHIIRRRPPPQMHRIQTNETVTVRNKKNDDWESGTKVNVKAISPRQPNVLHVENEDGSTTFLHYFDVARNGSDQEMDEWWAEQNARKADPIGSKYLMWP